MDGNWKLSCTSTYIFSEVLSVKARFAGGEMILVVGHSQHLKVWQVWQGEIKDEYEAKEDTGFEEVNQERVKKGAEDFGKYSELPTLPSKPIVVRPRCTCFSSVPLFFSLLDL